MTNRLGYSMVVAVFGMAGTIFGAGTAMACSPAAGGDDFGVRNGSFRSMSGPDQETAWWRSDPQLKLVDTGFWCNKKSQHCPWEDPSFVSIGRSVLHCPEAISAGNLPLLTGDECLVSDSCLPSGERESVLRIRVNHPSAPLASPGDNGTSEIAVANIFQTDIRLEAPSCVGADPSDVSVLLRFDHFGLHPTGGTALVTRLIAERCDRDEDGVDWGSAPDLMPFSTIQAPECAPRGFDMTVLGSPVLRCENADGDPVEQWMPRQLPFDCDGSPSTPFYCDGSQIKGSCAQIELIASLEPTDEDQPPPSAAWRTVEMRVPVFALPQWDCTDGLDQIEAYRFTIAFRPPQEAVYLGEDTLENCGDDGSDDFCVKAVTSENYVKLGLRIPAYSELDQVELHLAVPSEVLPCDVIHEGDCGGQWSLSECRQSEDLNEAQIMCSYPPSGGALPVGWVQEPDGQDLESVRSYTSLEYSAPDLLQNGHGRGVCKACDIDPNNPVRGIYSRSLVEGDSYVPAEVIQPCRPGDFNCDGDVMRRCQEKLLPHGAGRRLVLNNPPVHLSHASWNGLE